MSHLPLPQRRPGMPGAFEPRIGTEERDEAVDLLSQHFAAGRITHEELQERSALALRAQTRSQLVPLLADLPPLPRSRAQHGPSIGWVIGGWTIAALSAITSILLGLFALVVMVAGHAGIGTIVAPLLPLLVAVAAGWFAYRAGQRRR